MAEVHSRAARASGATLYGGASSSADSSRRAAEQLGFERWYANADDLLADDAIDVVHICTPNSTHAHLALKAIERGKHVICEKPLATSAADARRLTDAADLAGLTATVPFVYRYHPMVREARARMASGEVGTLLSIHGSYLQDWLLEPTDDNWRVDRTLGGPSRAFADIGSHLVDLVEFVTGDRIATVNATTRTVFSQRSQNRNIATEDLVAVVVKTAGGAVGTLLISQVAPGRKNALVLEIAGDRQSIRFDQEQPEILWIGQRSGSMQLLRDGDRLDATAARISPLPAGHPLGYQDAFNAFVADSYVAIAGDAPDGLPVFADGLRQAQITEGVLRSAIDGTWEDVSVAALAQEAALS